MDSLLRILKTNARLSSAELAVMVGLTEEEVDEKIAAFERSGVIKGYTAIIDDAAIDPGIVTALIELKVTPQSQSGYDAIGREIAEYDEVDGVRLMSGSYDILVSVTGRSVREVSQFVFARLAAIDGVTSTTTHFELKSYKFNGVPIYDEDTDERGMVSP